MQFLDGIARQWNDTRLRPDLKQMLSLVDAYAIARFNHPIIITSIFRPDSGSVHSVWRGADARASRSNGMDGLDFYFTNEEAGDIRNFCNWLYRYTDEHRPCVYHENRGAPGKHLHFQVPTAPLFLSLNTNLVLDSFIRMWMSQALAGIYNGG